MDFRLTTEQEDLRRKTAEFARARLRYDLARSEAEGCFPREAWTAVGRQGLLGLPLPEALGGGGRDLVTTALAWEALGAGCPDPGLCFALATHFAAGVVPIWKAGLPDQQHRWLPALLDGTRIAASAATEPEAGSDLFAMRTRALRKGDGYELNGTKVYATNAPIADLLLVYGVTAETEGKPSEISLFVVERGTPGLHLEPLPGKSGLRTAPWSKIRFERCFVQGGNRIGEAGAGRAIFQTAIEWERTLLYAPALGAIERLLESTVAHARGRRQFGEPIGRFQSVSRRIVRMKLRLETGRLLLYRAAEALSLGGHATVESAMAKLWVSEAWVKSSLDAVQILGASGVFAEADAARQLACAVPATISSGTSEIQELLIARWLGL
jgi:alkylation response protein AidB-like acyl-CoA dehydrogenase